MEGLWESVGLVSCRKASKKEGKVKNLLQSLSQSFPNPNHWYFEPRPDLPGLSTGAGLAGGAQPQSQRMEGTEPLHKHCVKHAGNTLV